MTWNYTEAGHGKGPMDGVGGTLKREADRKVHYGADITSAKEFIEAVKDINVLLVEIPEKDIETMKKNIVSQKVPAIGGIMKVHQITYSQGVTFSRYLSCFECSPSQHCDHFTFSEVFPDDDTDIHEPNECEEQDPMTLPIMRKAKLSVDDIYTSSDDEHSRIQNARFIPNPTLPSTRRLKLKPKP